MVSAKLLRYILVVLSGVCLALGCAREEKPARGSTVRTLKEKPVAGRIRAVRKFRKDWLSHGASDRKLRERYGLTRKELKQVKRAVQKRSLPTLPDLVPKRRSASEPSQPSERP